MTMIPSRTAPAHRRTFHRAALAAVLGALILGAALSLGGGSRAVEAAIDPPAATTIGTIDAPGYELEGFRWNRAVVPVYYTWEGGTCVFAGNNFTGPTTTIAESVLLETLQTSIAEINLQLRGGLTLQFSGLATRAELCSTSSAKPLVVGFGAITSTGQALSYGTAGTTYSNYTAARVFITTKNNFSCPTAPIYRDLQHTMTHELLHAIGIGHSNVPSAIMGPTFVACRTPHTMQADDIAAINQLYPPTLPPPASTAVGTATSTPPAPATPTVAGVFSSPILFSTSGQSLAVFPGGSFDELEAAARTVGATGIWVQDASGTFRLLVVGGPGFLRDQFRAAFPAGLPRNLAVTLVR